MKELRIFQIDSCSSLANNEVFIAAAWVISTMWNFYEEHKAARQAEANAETEKLSAWEEAIAKKQ